MARAFLVARSNARVDARAHDDGHTMRHGCEANRAWKPVKNYFERRENIQRTQDADSVRTEFHRVAARSTRL